MQTTDRSSLITAAKLYVQASLGLDRVAMISLQETADAAWLNGLAFSPVVGVGGGGSGGVG